MSVSQNLLPNERVKWHKVPWGHSIKRVLYLALMAYSLHAPQSKHKGDSFSASNGIAGGKE